MTATIEEPRTEEIATVVAETLPLSAEERTAIEQQVRDKMASLDGLETTRADEEKALRHLLLRLHEGNAHTGHGTWEAYCLETFGLDNWHSYHHLNRARMEWLFSQPDGSVDPVNKIMTDSTVLTELVTLTGKQAKALWKYALPVKVEAWRRGRLLAENPGPALLVEKAEEILREQGSKVKTPRGNNSEDPPEPKSNYEKTFDDLSITMKKRIPEDESDDLHVWWMTYIHPAMIKLHALIQAKNAG